MIAGAYRAARMLRDWMAVRNRAHARTLTHHRLPHRDFGPAPLGGILLKRWRLEVPAPQVPMVLATYPTLTALADRYPDSFRLTPTEDALLVRFGGITMATRTAGDVEVLREVFLDELYRFTYPEPVVAWDVGMNTGAASLYLAGLPHVHAVFGCEIFKPTFAEALANFALNPDLRERITAWCEGAGDDDASQTLPYAEAIKGIVGLNGPLHQHAGITLREERVTVRRASAMVERIRAAHPVIPIFLKMDCEGAELRILAELAAAGMLREISMMIMEWHGEDRLRGIEGLLVQHGYRIAVMRFRSGSCGLLSAAAGA